MSPIILTVFLSGQFVLTDLLRFRWYFFKIYILKGVTAESEDTWCLCTPAHALKPTLPTEIKFHSNVHATFPVTWAAVMIKGDFVTFDRFCSVSRVPAHPNTHARYTSRLCNLVAYNCIAYICGRLRNWLLTVWMNFTLMPRSTRHCVVTIPNTARGWVSLLRQLIARMWTTQLQVMMMMMTRSRDFESNSIARFISDVCVWDPGFCLIL